jgi:hypothetical protein
MGCPKCCSAYAQPWKPNGSACCTTRTALASAYSAQLWAKGRFTEFIRDGEPWQARALDVDAHGRLVVEGREGEVEALGMERLRFGVRH